MAELEPVVDALMDKARRREPQGMELPSNDVPDDGRLYSKVVDPDEATLYARPTYGCQISCGAPKPYFPVRVPKSYFPAPGPSKQVGDV